MERTSAVPVARKIKVVNGWPDPRGLSKEKLVGLVMDIQGILWAGEDGKPDMEQQWSADEIEAVAEALIKAGMAPKED